MLGVMPNMKQSKHRRKKLPVRIQLEDEHPLEKHVVDPFRVCSQLKHPLQRRA